MFTGIVRGRYSVTRVTGAPGLVTIEVELDEAIRSVLDIGASVAVDGVCLTVTELSAVGASFDIMQETLRVTTLGEVAVGRLVNIEPSLSVQRDISGHIVSGHVDTTARISVIDYPDEQNCTVVFAVEPTWCRYLFQKGYVAVNGCSLTVGRVDKKSGEFCVYLIPETMRRTTFGLVKVGDRVNIEVERQTQIIVDTITDCMERFIGELRDGGKGGGGSSSRAPRHQAHFGSPLSGPTTLQAEQ